MKTCTKCGEFKPLSEFYTDRSRRDGYTYWCRACTRRYQSTDSYKQKKNLARKGKSYTPAAKAQQSRWAISNRERCRERQRASQKRSVNALSDSYVKGQIAQRYSLQRADVPVDLINLKREQIRLQRLAKEMQQAATQAKEHDEPVSEHP